MATKTKRNPSARLPEVGTRELWLAALGAASLARKQAIDTAGSIGGQFESLASQAKAVAGEGKRRALGLVGKVEGKLKPLLARAGLGAKAPARKTARKPASRKTAARKTSARKTSRKAA